MDCREYQEDLTAYMDGELTSSRANEIKVHVQRCKECAEEFESLKESALFLESNTQELELDPRLWRNVKAQLSSVQVVATRPTLLQLLLGHRWATGAVALAAVFVLAFGVWSYREHQADEQGLLQYMNEYVHAREIQENQESIRPYRTPASAETYPDYPDYYMDNPFVTVRPVSLENPFRSEAR